MEFFFKISPPTDIVVSAIVKVKMKYTSREKIEISIRILNFFSIKKI